jgi:outer membrane protein OmpA-like peptidoglycan-associated protein
MMKLLSTLILLLYCLNQVDAQVDKGDKAYSELSYAQAITYYEKALSKKKDPSVSARLGHCYRLTGNTEAAEQRYAEAIEGGLQTIEVRQQYAQMLLTNGKTAEARAQAERLITLNANDRSAQNIIKACDNRDLLLKMGDQYLVSLVAFNAEGADFCPTYAGDDLVFTSDRSTDEDAEKSTWTGRGYTSIFRVPLVGGSAPEPLQGDVNGQYNDGAAVFTADGEQMYFTRNNYQEKERRRSKDDVVNLIITGAKKSGNQWAMEVVFPYNSTEFNSAHPAISTDGQRLVFASDRPGGHGGMDLWACEWSGTGWSMPYNLGPSVNSPGNEIFPFLTPQGQLIFASNGWPGIGGLDIFISDPAGDAFFEPRNIGAPINSAKDDFGCITRDNLQTGFFSSNVNSVDGTEDIFQFKRKPAPPPVYAYKMSGVVVDLLTQIPLPGVLVTLENVSANQSVTATTGENGRFEFDLKPNTDYRVSGLKNGITTNINNETTTGRGANTLVFTQLEHNDPRFTLRGTAINRKTSQPVEGVDVKLLNTSNLGENEAMTDAAGKFFFQLAQNSDYTITGQKAGVFTSVKNASTKGLDRSTDLYVQLTLNVDIIEIGQEIALEDIFFDLNKADIRPDAAKVLDNLVAFLQRSPGVIIEMASHTDARNTHPYNEALSQRRAESTMQYLITQGIEPGRLTAKGYGETQLVNRCADGVTCSEAEHQQNRRTTFKVLKY